MTRTPSQPRHADGQGERRGHVDTTRSETEPWGRLAPILGLARQVEVDTTDPVDVRAVVERVRLCVT